MGRVRGRASPSFKPQTAPAFWANFQAASWCLLDLVMPRPHDQSQPEAWVFSTGASAKPMLSLTSGVAWYYSSALS